MVSDFQGHVNVECLCDQLRVAEGVIQLSSGAHGLIQS